MTPSIHTTIPASVEERLPGLDPCNNLADTHCVLLLLLLATERLCWQYPTYAAKLRTPIHRRGIFCVALILMTK